MPVNPFQNSGVGSRGNERNIASEARAIRAYDNARKRLLATMNAEQQAQLGIDAAHTATMKSRMKDHAAHSRELLKTTSLLDAQGDTLKNLNVLRERYHTEEMSRSESLLQRYESIKTALNEIQEDYKDSTTTIGYLFTPIAEGIDNLSKFGTIGKSSRPIRDVSFSLKTLGSDTLGVVGSVSNLGVSLADTFGQVRSYEKQVDALNESAAKMDLRFGTASGHAKELQTDFVNLSRTDLGMDGSVKSVEAVTHSLMMLEAQGVDASAAMELIVSRSRQSGISWEESARHVEVLTTQADMLTDALHHTKGAVGTLTVGVRDDFVRAIADATRNLESNIISVENVGAAYANAALKVAAYGASNESVTKVASALVADQVGATHTAFTSLSGERTGDALREALARQERETNTHYTENPTTDSEREVNTRLRTQTFREVGVEETAENRHDLTIALNRSLENNALADQTVRNLMAGTEFQSRNDIMTIRDLIGGVDSRTAQAQILQGNGMGVGLNESQMDDYIRVIREGSVDDAVAATQAFQETAAATAESQAPPLEQALSALATMKDPIQSLTNMKEYLKSIMMNVSNIVSALGTMKGFADSFLQPDTTNSVLNEEALQAAQAQRKASEETARTAIETRRRDLRGANPEQAAVITAEISAAERMAAITQANLARADDARKTAQAAAASAPSASSSLPTFAVPAIATSVVNSLGNLLSSASEEGRTQGMSTLASAASSASSAAPARPAPARPTPGAVPPGHIVATGTGRASVTPAGESIMDVRMVISNMSEVIAHVTTGEARLQDAIGAGG